MSSTLEMQDLAAAIKNIPSSNCIIKVGNVTGEVRIEVYVTPEQFIDIRLNPNDVLSHLWKERHTLEDVVLRIERTGSMIFNV